MRLLSCCVLAIACDGTMPVDAGMDAGIGEDAGSACTYDAGEIEEPPEPSRSTARWAFEPWISKDISDREDTYEFVSGFLDRDIPVGAIVIDSPWDSQYTTFRPNPTRYPDFAEMVADMHAMGVRVVMWTTQMVNRQSYDLETGGDSYVGPSPNYAQGCECGFFVNDCERYTWWKGIGSAVDFFHPQARAWWHQQQDLMLDAGIDGWKLDFGESYLESDQTLETYAGPTPHQEYSEAYYRDFLAYGRLRRGEDFVTMVRPYDVSYDRIGRFHARPEHAPVAWVGDNHRDWTGLVDALDHVFRSAEAGYVVVGSDMGGYLDRDERSLMRLIPFDLEVFQRWVAIGAMMPFMQLHGRANLAPWTVPEDADETVESYRFWATLHHEMVGFWYSLAREAYANEGVILHPVGEEASWPGDYRYVIGEHFLIAPILDNGGVRDVVLPEGRWYDFWDPSADAMTAMTIEDYDASAPGRIPVFVREGAIVPVTVDNDVTGNGNAASSGHLTILAWPATTRTTFTYYDDDTSSTEIALEGTRIELTRAVVPVIVRMRASGIGSVSRGATALTQHADRAAFDGATEGWLADGPWVWIKTPASASAITLEASP
jgi:alpha-glucosidase (family GH31 glycosyl hydrolase)